MTSKMAAGLRSQAGFTLVELLIATALGLLVLSALTSVVLTASQATKTANERVQASAQVRGFQFTAYDDFVLARAPAPAGCGTPAAPCTTQTLDLSGSRESNQGGLPAPYFVRYTWNPATQEVTRYTDTTSRVAASNVTAYSWYVDRDGANPAVVVSMTVTVAAYSESQVFRFYPRVTAPPTP